MKFNRKQLSDIKKSFKESKKDDIADKNTYQQRSLLKKQARALKDPEEAFDLKKQKKALRSAAEAKNYNIEWNINIGDAVEFKINKRADPEFGIVIKISKADSYKSMKDAMSRSYVQVMSQRGNQWISLVNVVRIEDEDQ